MTNRIFKFNFKMSQVFAEVIKKVRQTVRQFELSFFKSNKTIKALSRDLVMSCTLTG